MKKKKKKSATPKKAARRGASGVLKKAKKGPASKPKKQKKPTKPAPAKKGKKKTGTAPCTNPVYPEMCTQNFPAENGQCVQFTDLPALTVRITQDGDVYPFTPITGHDSNGAAYTDVTASTWLTVDAPASPTPQTYPYTLDCDCGDQPDHSVTVDS